MAITVYDIRHPGPAYEGTSWRDLPKTHADDYADQLIDGINLAREALRKLRPFIWDDRMLDYNDALLQDLLSDAEYMQEKVRKGEFV